MRGCCRHCTGNAVLRKGDQITHRHSSGITWLTLGHHHPARRVGLLIGAPCTTAMNAILQNLHRGENTNVFAVTLEHQTHPLAILWDSPTSSCSLGLKSSRQRK